MRGLDNPWVFSALNKWEHCSQLVILSCVLQALPAMGVCIGRNSLWALTWREIYLWIRNALWSQEPSPPPSLTFMRVTGLVMLVKDARTYLLRVLYIVVYSGGGHQDEKHFGFHKIRMSKAFIWILVGHWRRINFAQSHQQISSQIAIVVISLSFCNEAAPRMAGAVSRTFTLWILCRALSLIVLEVAKERGRLMGIFAPNSNPISNHSWGLLFLR